MHRDLHLPIDAGENVRRREQLQRIPQADVHAMLSEASQGRVSDLQRFRLRAQLDDVPDLLGGVGVRGDDEQAGEEVRGNAMRGDDVFGAADGAFAAVGGEDHDGRDGRFEGAVKVGEAFDVEHVDLGCLSLARHTARLRGKKKSPRQ